MCFTRILDFHEMEYKRRGGGVSKISRDKSTGGVSSGIPDEKRVKFIKRSRVAYCRSTDCPS